MGHLSLYFWGGVLKKQQEFQNLIYIRLQEERVSLLGNRQCFRVALMHGHHLDNYIEGWIK